MLLGKGIYPYECMNSWEKFDEISLPTKERFYSELNSDGISNEDYEHSQKVWEVFEINNRDEYHDLYVQSDTLLVADVFENFRNMCLDPVYFVSAPGLAWQAGLKKTEVKLELLTDYYMILMIEKGLGVEFAKQHIGMLEQIIHIWKIKIKTLSHLYRILRRK